MPLFERPSIESLIDCIKRLDSWDTTGPDRELDCRIAYALGHEWWGGFNVSWRWMVENNGFVGAWAFDPVFDKNSVPRFTSSYDVVQDSISEIMPEADQISWSCDPSGCGASVGVWHLTCPVDKDIEEHQPYIWPHGKGYANSGLHAMLRAFLEAVLQRERGDVFEIPKQDLEANAS